MSCLSVIASRIGGLLVKAKRGIGGISTVMTKIGGMTATMVKASGMNPGMTRVGGLTCRMGLVCGTGLGEEDILWAVDGIVLNALGNKIYITVKR